MRYAVVALLAALAVAQVVKVTSNAIDIQVTNATAATTNITEAATITAPTTAATIADTTTTTAATTTATVATRPPPVSEVTLSAAGVPVTTAAGVPVTTTAGVPVTTTAGVPVTTATPVPVTTAAPVSITTAVPVPVTTAAPVPVTTATPVPVTIAAPVAVTTAAPVAVTTAAPVQIITVYVCNNSIPGQQVPVKIPKTPLFCDKCVKPCGTTPPAPAPEPGTGRAGYGKLFNGKQVRENEFGWAGILSKQYPKTYCGATLITKKHVLTAGHCTEFLDPSDIVVTIGDYDYNHFPRDGPGKSFHQVKAIYQHPEFRKLSKFDADISVVELETPVDLSNPWVRVACLPRSKDINYVGINATVIGWGKSSEVGIWATYLRKVELPILNNEDCKNMGYKNEKYLITDNMICAGFENGIKDSCKGDSGGAMLRYTNNDKSVMELIGVISWGKGCGRSFYPGFYTKVVNYLDWINEQIGSECLCGTESS